GGGEADRGGCAGARPRLRHTARVPRPRLARPGPRAHRSDRRPDRRLVVRAPRDGVSRLRVALLLNPVSRRAGHDRGAVGGRSMLAGLGALLVLPTTVGEPGEQQTRQALAAGVDRVVVAGGDGKVRLVA